MTTAQDDGTIPQAVTPVQPVPFDPFGDPATTGLPPMPEATPVVAPVLTPSPEPTPASVSAPEAAPAPVEPMPAPLPVAETPATPIADPFANPDALKDLGPTTEELTATAPAATPAEESSTFSSWMPRLSSDTPVATDVPTDASFEASLMPDPAPVAPTTPGTTPETTPEAPVVEPAPADFSMTPDETPAVAIPDVTPTPEAPIVEPTPVAAPAPVVTPVAAQTEEASPDPYKEEAPRVDPASLDGVAKLYRALYQDSSDIITLLNVHTKEGFALPTEDDSVHYRVSVSPSSHALQIRKVEEDADAGEKLINFLSFTYDLGQKRFSLHFNDTLMYSESPSDTRGNALQGQVIAKIELFQHKVTDLLTQLQTQASAEAVQEDLTNQLIEF